MYPILYIIGYVNQNLYNMEIISRICTKCGKEKSLEEFSRSKVGKYGRRSYCKECEHKIQNSPEYLARRNAKRIERRKNAQYVEHCNQKDKETIHSNIVSFKKSLIRAAKQRAKVKNIPFSITIDDFDLPEICPLLGIKLEINFGKAEDNSYSLDRIFPEKGYIPGNVWIISKRANTLKNNASLEELKFLVNNLENKLKTISN